MDKYLECFLVSGFLLFPTSPFDLLRNRYCYSKGVDQMKEYFRLKYVLCYFNAE